MRALGSIDRDPGHMQSVFTNTNKNEDTNTNTKTNTNTNKAKDTNTNTNTNINKFFYTDPWGHLNMYYFCFRKIND